MTLESHGTPHFLAVSWDVDPGPWDGARGQQWHHCDSDRCWTDAESNWVITAVFSEKNIMIAWSNKVNNSEIREIREFHGIPGCFPNFFVWVSIELSMARTPGTSLWVWSSSCQRSKAWRSSSQELDSVGESYRWLSFFWDEKFDETSRHLINGWLGVAPGLKKYDTSNSWIDGKRTELFLESLFGSGVLLEWDDFETAFLMIEV